MLFGFSLFVGGEDAQGASERESLEVGGRQPRPWTPGVIPGVIPGVGPTMGPVLSPGAFAAPPPGMVATMQQQIEALLAQARDPSP